MDRRHAQLHFLKASMLWKLCLIVSLCILLPSRCSAFSPSLARITRTPTAASIRSGRIAPAAGAHCTAVRPREIRSPVGDWGKIAELVERPKRPPLPRLTPQDEARLAQGGIVHKQTRTGRIGQGLSVVEVNANVATALAVLSDLDRYEQRISTVYEAEITRRGSRKCKASFKLSRFRLEVAAEFALNLHRNMLEFRLDPDVKTAAFDQARGFWFVEESPSRPGYSRIFLSAKLVCSPLLPSFIVDYAATKALPKATCWLQPVIEAIASGLPQGAEDVHRADHRRNLKSRAAGPVAVHPEWHPPA